MKSLKKILRWILGIGMTAAGIYHFINPEFYLKIMPPYLPAPLFLVYLSGFFEIAFGALLLIRRFAPRAAWGIVALLIAVFPANIYMAMNTELFPEISPIALYLRLPLQLVLVAWAFWFTRHESLK